jgi:hypothetical protein
MDQLKQIDFGVGASQQERHLADYFYRSGLFEEASSEKTALILGGKGAGKSAIFRMFGELKGDIPIFREPNMLLRDEPRLRDLWATLQAYGVSSKATLWRFYIASLIVEVCINHGKLPPNLEKDYQRFLVRWGLVREIPTPWQAMKKVKVSLGIGNYLKTEVPPSSPLGINEIEYVIVSADNWLGQIGAEIWICLDSLDEVSTNGPSQDETEELLSSLMRTVGELIRLRQIRFKLFFRTDIYDALTYVNKDHFSGLKVELRWSREDLAIILGHRLHVLHPSHSTALDYPTSQEWIDEVFEWPNTGLLTSFDGLYETMRDGNGVVLPRDVVNFCIGAQKLQLGFNIQGIEKPSGNKLISARAIREAFRQTASAKLSDFLQVFQNFSETYDQLKGSPQARFTRAELGLALGKPDLLDAGLVIADLVRVGALGILDNRSVNRSDDFAIPLLYAIALKIGDSHERI